MTRSWLATFLTVVLMCVSSCSKCLWYIICRDYCQQFLASRHGACFASPWIWAGLVICFDHWNVVEVMLRGLWIKRPSSFCHHFLGIWLPPCKEVCLRLLNDKKLHGDSSHVENNHDAPGNSWDQVPWHVSEAILDLDLDIKYGYKNMYLDLYLYLYLYNLPLATVSLENSD